MRGELNSAPEAMALEVRGLSKSFGRKVVEGLDLTIHPGEFYALLGPNGVGKTTTLRMIAGLMRPDAGSIKVFGRDVLADPLGAKAIMAWLPDEPLLYDRLSPLEYLAFIAGLWRVDSTLAKTRAEELLETLGLWPYRNERCEGFSRGMKQKTVLAGALIHDPQLLLLDEPFTGLDAASAKLVKTILSRHADAGAAIILTTHILEVAERLATRIGILSGGALLAEGDLPALRALAGLTGGTLEDVFLHLTTA
ncbi:MAG: ABC transporter ATP-binding protein [Acidocella sp.]|nr:ABC transporter ATP-binding protein [Acidocella sp.]